MNKPRIKKTRTLWEKSYGNWKCEYFGFTGYGYCPMESLVAMRNTMKRLGYYVAGGVLGRYL